MPRWSWLRRALVGALAVVAAGSLVAVDAGLPVLAQTLDDLDEAEERVAGIEQELDEATAAYEATWADIELAREEITGLERRAAELEREADRAAHAVALRARQTWKHGTTATWETLLASTSGQAAVERAGLLAALQRQERSRLEDALVLRTLLDRTEVELTGRLAELDELELQLRADADRLQERLEAAEAEAATIRSLVARQRRIDRGPQQGIYACIFDRGSFRFRDTWGAPRSGGRRHRGTDVFAPLGQPTYAFTSGVVQRHSNSRLGGLGLYLRGDDGNVYYYAHLQRIEPRGAVGTRVTAGELIARNGYSGNADPWAPHVHFELHPGGGAAINPYPWLAAACF